MSSLARLIAREYRRLSDAAGGTSIDDQGAENGAAADENGWDLHGEPYIDDGLSASRYARKSRDDFDQLVADLESAPTGRESRFGADILMLWESSRGSRRVGEWVSFIELCEQKHVRIWVTTHERLYDPANGRDRKSLIEDAADSEYESYKTHRRVTRTAANQARAGRPYGEAPYGLMPVYDPKTGKFLNWVEDPNRSMVPRELFIFLEKGFSLYAIESEFAKRGYLNRSGRPFSRSHLRDMALRHSYAGYRYHKGEIYEGTWKGIVPRDRFWNVQRILRAPERVTHRGGGAKHVLTAGLTCGVCTGLFKVSTRSGRKPSYVCEAGCLYIQKAPVDELVIGSEIVNRDGTRVRNLGTLLAYLARKDLHQLLAVPGSDDAAMQELRDALSLARAERDEMRQAKGSNMAEIAILSNSLAAKEQQVDELEGRERQLTLPPSILKLVDPGGDVWDSWHRAPISARREVARILLAPRLLGELVILPSPRRGPIQSVLERLEYRRTDG